MEKKSPLIAVIGIIAVVVLSLGLLCGYILSSPVELIRNSAGNFICNIMNGGDLLEDQGYLFYIIDGELYRSESDHPDEKRVKIADNCEGYLQVIDKTYYFQQNGNLVSCNYEGKNVKTILEKVSQPQVVGSVVYYINDSGELYKYSMRYDRVTALGLKPEGKIAVYYNRIYYTCNDGICSVSTDGSDNKTLINESADDFVIDGKYIFYSKGGAIYSAIKGDDGEFKTTKMTEGGDFFVNLNASMIAYSNKDGAFLADMNSLTKDEKYKPTKLGDSGTIYGDENYFYLLQSGKPLERYEKDGSNHIAFK
ncbi:MAG: DUF5050 domain-containing protein [Acutalibacteraceae bacterium]